MSKATKYLPQTILFIVFCMYYIHEIVELFTSYECYTLPVP